MLYGGNRTSTTGYGYNQRTPEPLDEPTKKLFDAIDDENLEALEEGADVNAFDAGYTPLMAIIMNGDDSPICLKMMMLLLQHKSLNINAQETKECNTALNLAFLMENRNFVQMLLRHPGLNVNIKNNHYMDFRGNFFHTPEEYIRKIGETQGKDFSYLTMEIQKAQKGKQLLNALSNRSVYLAGILLNEELNPNCWRRSRSRSEEIETPLSLICLQGITPDNEEVLTKLLKHKDLDFSQMKPIQAIEQNQWVKQIIEQAIKERLIDVINSKDLDDVKKLVEDNCFINRAIVTAALRDVNNPIESITNYLNEKFSANTNNIPKDFEGFVEELVDELERTKAQLIEKERELDRVVRERTRGLDKISQLERDLRQVKQEKLSQQTKINDLNSELIQCKRIVSERASDTVEISQLKRDLKQVREERDRLLSENRYRLASQQENYKN